MLKEEYSFTSNDGMTEINCTEWIPDSREVRAIIQISHGIGEHIGRYEELAKFLTERDIAVVGNDCIGHGLSKSSRKNPMYFGPEGSWKYLVRDMMDFNLLIGESYPDVPHFMLGFSMGSFLVRTALTVEYPEKIRIDGAILAGTGRLSPIVAKLVKFLINKEAKKSGEDEENETINKLAFENYNKFFKPTKTRFDWLCQDEAAIQEYISDELTRKFITPGMFRELISAMEYVSRESSIKKLNDLPILFMSGEQDPVGEFKKGIVDVVKKHEKYNPDVNLILYPNSRHDIFHDNDKIVVMEDLYSWIEWAIKNK